MAHLGEEESWRGAVWIPPPDAALDRLQTLARRVRARLGGPALRLHLSLLAGLEQPRLLAERRLKELAHRVGPLRLRTGRLDFHDAYHRAFFLRVELSQDLRHAQRVAHEIFEMNPPLPFEPHISLAYGDFDRATRAALAAELGGALELEFEATTVQLVNAAPGVPVAQWRPLRECRLGDAAPRPPVSTGRPTARA